MATDLYKACIKVAACVCAKDGIISEVEEQEMYRILSAEFRDIDEAAFDQALTEFFDSEEQIEDYLGQIDDHALRLFTLRLAEVSAAADGLDTRENIALEKAYTFWGVRSHA